MPQFSKLQLQKIRRHTLKEAKLQDDFSNYNIKCCNYSDLINAEVVELDKLSSIIKKIKIHRKATDRLLQEKLIDNDEIKEPLKLHKPLLAYLQEEYKGVKGQKIKFTHENKDKRRQIIIQEHQDKFNNCLTIEAENSITELFNGITDLKVSFKYYDDLRKSELLKIPMIEPVEEEQVPAENLILDAPELPKIDINLVVVNKKLIKKNKLTVKPAIITDDVNDSDDEDINDFELRIKRESSIDQDVNSKEDLKKWSSLIKKQIKADLRERMDEFLFNEPVNDEYSHLEDERNEKTTETKSDIINDFLRPFKTVKNRNKTLTNWTSRNPASTKKIIEKLIIRIEASIKRENTIYEKDINNM